MGQRETGAGRSVGVGRYARLALGASMAVALLAGCGGSDAAGAPSEDPVVRITAPDDVSGDDDAELPGALAIAPTSIPVLTYEGSGELVHPDVSFFPRGFWGMRYWYAATPYPAGNATFENPSIYNGASSAEMRVPDGLANPLAKPEPSSYLSDPDIAYDPQRRELRMYYRQTTQGADQIFLVKSSNGTSWGKSQLALSGVRYSLISPAIVREGDGSWRMWTVNASAAGCRSSLGLLSLQQRRSSDGTSWGAPEPVNLTIAGRVPWHWDVQYVRAKDEYWAMVAAYPDGSNCSQTSLYFARSADGTSWKVSPTPLLRAGDFYPIRELVYRSTFRYHEGSDAVSVWFSGARLEEGVFRYSVALARYPMDELLRRVNNAPLGTLEIGSGQHSSKELRAARAAFVAAFP
jgi:hypothetical protein